MTEVAFSLSILPPQAAERINFELEPGVVMFAILFFVLVNLLLAAVLYPYLTGSSEEQQVAAKDATQEELIEEEGPPEDEPLEQRVDDFLEDIEKS